MVQNCDDIWNNDAMRQMYWSCRGYVYWAPCGLIRHVDMPAIAGVPSLWVNYLHCNAFWCGLFCSRPFCIEGKYLTVAWFRTSRITHTMSMASNPVRSVKSNGAGPGSYHDVRPRGKLQCCFMFFCSYFDPFADPWFRVQHSFVYV